MNWLAAPFGSQEDLLLTYGLKDQDYALDDKGNPKPSTDGISRAGYVPWRYIAQHPWVYYRADRQGLPRPRTMPSTPRSRSAWTIRPTVITRRRNMPKATRRT